MGEIRIGPSNGYFCASGIYSPVVQEELLTGTGANAIEFMLFAEEPQRTLALIESERTERFQYLSIHISCKLPKAKQRTDTDIICRRHKVDTAVIHPVGLPPEYWEMLSSLEVPVAVENMDKEKEEGIKIEELRELMDRYDLYLVLDVQHAFEHDPTMSYAKDLLFMAGDRLRHFHVSGENEKTSHSLVHFSTNVNQIIDFLGMALFEFEKPAFNVPLILEGEYQTAAEIKEEIDFLRTELAFT